MFLEKRRIEKEKNSGKRDIREEMQRKVIKLEENPT